jgi:hypothetical protein
MALSQFFDPAQHCRAIGVTTSKSGKLLLEAAGVTGLCIGVAQFLGKRRIPIHYGAEELAEDLRAVESLAAR